MVLLQPLGQPAHRPYLGGGNLLHDIRCGGECAGCPGMPGMSAGCSGMPGAEGTGVGSPARDSLCGE